MKNSLCSPHHSLSLGSKVLSLLLFITILCSLGFAQKEVKGAGLSGATIKPDIETLRGVWKDTNSRSRNMRISVEHGRISIH